MIFLALLSILHKSYGQGQQVKKENTMKKNNHTIEFVNHYSTFKMDIQAAGLASITMASISDSDELYIEYSYHSENESRNGKMKLQKRENNKFEGNWKTEADNGNVYEGSLYFLFKSGGQADGYYKYSGSDYKITIFK